MILLADAGSTKTIWAWVTSCEHGMIEAEGINPLQLSIEEIKQRLSVLNPFLPKKPKAVYYYGTGINSSSTSLMQALLSELFPQADVYVFSDILAVAHALSPDRPSMIYIIGTGSASCLWSGQQILSKVPSGGFLLGDEGSGVWLGKQFLIRYIRDEWPQRLQEAFQSFINLSNDALIQQLYSQRSPNRYLASFVPFIYENKQIPELRQLIIQSFDSLLSSHLHYYHKHIHSPNVDTGYFAGSVAYFFKEELQEASASRFKIGAICRSPMNQLITYYQKKWTG